MIGILVVTRDGTGAELIRVAQHIFGFVPVRLEALTVAPQDTVEALMTMLGEHVRALDDGDGVLLLTDGSVPANVAENLARSGQAEVLGNVSMPILLRVLNYRHLPLPDLINYILASDLSHIAHAVGALYSMPTNQGGPRLPRARHRGDIMDTKGLEVSFESHTPVAGQILILEALDFVYAVFALTELEWNETVANSSDWPRVISSHPGKLLRPEHSLTVESARAGSVVEVLSGAAGVLGKAFRFLSFYRLQVENHRVRLANEKLKIVHQELLPLADMLEKRGATRDQVDQLIAKAYLYIDEVLTSLQVLQRVELAWAAAPERPTRPCPMCNGAGQLANQ